MKIISKKSEKSLIDQFIRDFKKDYLRRKKQNKRLSFVLTGGKSPVRLYRKLAQINIDWNIIDLFWGDERYVSHQSKNSNFKLAYNEFIKKIKIDKKNVFPIKTNKSISKCSAEYSKKIKYTVNVEEGNRFVSNIKKNNKNITDEFASYFNYDNKVLSCSADGCGTKIDLSCRFKKLNTIIKNC